MFWGNWCQRDSIMRKVLHSLSSTLYTILFHSALPHMVVWALPEWSLYAQQTSEQYQVWHPKKKLKRIKKERDWLWGSIEYNVWKPLVFKKHNNMSVLDLNLYPILNKTARFWKICVEGAQQVLEEWYVWLVTVCLVLAKIFLFL